MTVRGRAVARIPVVSCAGDAQTARTFRGQRGGAKLAHREAARSAARAARSRSADGRCTGVSVRATARLEPTRRVARLWLPGAAGRGGAGGTVGTPGEGTAAGTVVAEGGMEVLVVGGW